MNESAAVSIEVSLFLEMTLKWELNNFLAGVFSNISRERVDLLIEIIGTL